MAFNEKLHPLTFSNGLQSRSESLDRRRRGGSEVLKMGNWRVFGDIDVWGLTVLGVWEYDKDCLRTEQEVFGSDIYRRHKSGTEDIE